PLNAPKVAYYDMLLLARLVHEDSALEQAVVVVRNRRRARETEVARRPLGAETTLKVKLADALTQHAVAGVYLFVERERVAQIAQGPVAVAERVFVDKEILVEPAVGLLHPRLELGLCPERAGVIGLRGKLPCQPIADVRFTLKWIPCTGAVGILRIAPKQQDAFIPPPIVPHPSR